MTPANRQYKDRLFRFLFGNEAYKENTLSLYNAINGTHYDNVNDLTLITIDDFLYLGMRNDVSMLVGRDISLYEHQSTWNPNMPLRGLMYFSRVFARYVEENGLDMYRRTPVSLPAPQYVILYNGEEDHGERTTLRLSDLYQDRRIGAVEVLATVIDINYEENKQILLSCRVLSEYAQLVAKVRDSQRGGSSLTEAIDAAVEDCISNGILAAVLKAHRAEVKEMLFTDYDPDVVRRHWEEDARAKGHAEGLAAGLAEGREEGLAEGREEGRAAGLAEGREEGLAAGREEGLAAGREEGLAAGREEGLAAGREEGRAAGLAAGREEGLKAGITKGSAEERLKIAKALKTEGMTTEVIVRVTGLTEEEIAAL